MASLNAFFKVGVLAAFLLSTPTLLVAQRIPNLQTGPETWPGAENCLFSKAQAKKMLDPEFRSRQEALERDLYIKASELIRGRLTPGSGRESLAEDILTIPLIIHVIHLSTEPNPGDGPSNPTDAQILAGIQHLNDAYRNIGVYGDNGHQSHPALQSVDVGIEFCLAQRDINGAPTTGILRYANDTFSNLNYDQEDPQMQQWVAEQDNFVYPGTDYAHVWLVNDICSGSGTAEDPENCNIAGYAYFPGGHGQVNNGVINLASYWGSSTNASKVHIHEFGHYLNLYHTFQGGCTNNDCLADGDRVCDTPPDNRQSYSNCGAADNSCSTDTDDTSANNPFDSDVDDLYENYMDYSSNACQNTFTQGQKDRMRLALLGTRSSLLSSQACIPVAGVEAGINRILYPDLNICNTTFSPVVEVQNNGDQPITSLTFAIYIDGNLRPEENWNGNLPSGEMSNISLSEISFAGPGEHELLIEILNSNGQPDPFSNNNRARKVFMYAASLTSLPFCSDLEINALPSGWTIYNPDNYVGFETYPVNTCADGGDYALALQTWGTFPSKQTVERILTQPIDLSHATEVSLSFDIAHALTYTNFNTILDISISRDCGLSYTSVYRKTGQELSTIYVPAGSADDPDAFYIPGSCSEWRTETIPLSSYLGDEILIRFEASTADIANSTYGYYWGNNLYLDNICLNGSGSFSDCSTEELELLNGVIASGTYDDAATIMAGTNLLANAEVYFEAAEAIYLLPGFTANEGSKLSAVIRPCGAAAQEDANDPMLLPSELAKPDTLEPFRLPQIELQLYPNPFAAQTTVRYYLGQMEATVEMRLTDMHGQTLRTFPFTVTESGWHEFLLDRKDLPTGIYFLQLRTKDQLISKKLVVI
ncbi:MAG: zinc-dependent metalloprotease [Saprospiraceae bacterium]|nr:zinc-dependent metalloprotease [Lewinella sp.]